MGIQYTYMHLHMGPPTDIELLLLTCGLFQIDMYRLVAKHPGLVDSLLVFSINLLQ